MTMPEDDTTNTDRVAGEVIKEELWRNIRGSELIDYPANVADKIVAALKAAGWAATYIGEGIDHDDIEISWHYKPRKVNVSQIIDDERRGL